MIDACFTVNCELMDELDFSMAKPSNEYREYFLGKPDHLIQSFAARGALRCLPMLWLPESRVPELLLPAQRAALCSAVISIHPDENVVAATAAAHKSLEATWAKGLSDKGDNNNFARGLRRQMARDAADCIIFSCSTLIYQDSAYSASIAVDFFSDFEATQRDVDLTQDFQIRGKVHTNPLWYDQSVGRHGALSIDLADCIERYKSSSPVFWRDWYQGFLDGKPMDWELQREVALISDEDWSKGPEHIAEVIERIRAEHLASKAPLAEAIELNPETGKLAAIPRQIANPDLLGAALSQVEDALDDALANPSNGLHEKSREVRVLRRT